MESDKELLIEALKLESTELNGRIQEIYKAVYTLFGAVLPAILTVFALLAKDASEGDRAHLAFIFVAVVSITSLWSSSLWMEALAFLRYRYLTFQPRFYQATGQQRERDVARFSLAGQRWRWFPSTLLNVMLFLVLFGVWWKFIPSDQRALWWTALAFPFSAVAGFVAVHLARLQYGRELQLSEHARDVPETPESERARGG